MLCFNVRHGFRIQGTRILDLEFWPPSSCGFSGSEVLGRATLASRAAYLSHFAVIIAIVITDATPPQMNDNNSVVVIVIIPIVMDHDDSNQLPW